MAGILFGCDSKTPFWGDKSNGALPANAAPTAVDDSCRAERGGAAVTVDPLANDTDSNGDILRIKSGSLTTPDHGGTAAISNDRIIYTPPKDYSGVETFRYTVTDGRGGEDEATVRVTVAKAWGDPVLIGDGNSVNAKNPQVAVLPDGDAVAVWIQDDGTNSRIRYSRYAAATNKWSDAEDVASGGSPAADLRVAADRDGNIMVIWMMQYSGHQEVMARYYRASDSTWDNIRRIDTNDYTPRAPHVAFDAGGNACAAWYQGYDGSHFGIFVNTFSPAGGWHSSARRIYSDIKKVFGGPDIATDSHGSVFVVWAKDKDSGSDIFACRYDPDTKRWSLAATVEADARTSSKVQLAVDRDGNAYVVWVGWDGNHRNIFARRYACGNGWEGTILPLQKGTESVDDAPRITIDGEGRATAIWAPQSKKVYTSTYIPGSGWSDAQSINSVNTGTPYRAQIAANTAGDTVAVWEQWDGSNLSIYASIRPEGSDNWGAATVIEERGNDACYPQVAVDADGHALAVWEHSDGKRWKVYANRFW